MISLRMLREGVMCLALCSLCVLIEMENIKCNVCLEDIPDICHLFYTTTICDLEILHLKVRKFGTKVVLQQNSVN